MKSWLYDYVAEGMPGEILLIAFLCDSWEEKGLEFTAQQKEGIGKQGTVGASFAELGLSGENNFFV